MEVKKLQVKSVFEKNNTRAERNRSSQDLAELMGSIKERGLLQPIGVVKERGKYRVVFGHRRYNAVKKLGEKTIEAKVFNKKDETELLLMTITENEQRENVSAYETGRIIHTLINKYKLGRNEVSTKLSIHTNLIRDYLTTYENTPEEFRDKVLYRPTPYSRKKGAIPLRLAAAISNMKKANKINAQQTKKLFELVSKESVSTDDLSRMEPSLEEGRAPKTVFNELKSYKKVSVVLQLTETKYKKLLREFGSLKGVQAFLKTVLREKVKDLKV